MGDERDAGLSHCPRGLGCFPLGNAAEAETVADRYLAAQAQRAGAGADLVNNEQPHLARLVQVGVARPRHDNRGRQPPQSADAAGIAAFAPDRKTVARTGQTEEL